MKNKESGTATYRYPANRMESVQPLHFLLDQDGILDGAHELSRQRGIDAIKIVVNHARDPFIDHLISQIFMVFGNAPKGPMQSPELKGISETNRSEQVRGAEVSRRAPQPDQYLGPALQFIEAIKVFVNQNAAPSGDLLRITCNRVLASARLRRCSCC